MTYKEAYKLIGTEVLNLIQGDDRNREAIIVALTAINKQIEDDNHWIPVATDQNGMTDTFKCSACGGHVYLQYPDDTCDYEYCPNCGQRMME